ncbi:MAG TPA: HDOD domain-containing protein, partial [Thermodesulfobacteriota bacterium]|nr:HDOD domain-containing protein [Thermodesulfobacteriota bacterium]
MPDKNANPAPKDFFYIKQPILDNKRSIWGYEIMVGGVKDGFHEIFAKRENTTGLSSSIYSDLQEAMGRGKQIMVGFAESSILSGMPNALPPGGVIRFLPPETEALKLCEALEKIRNDGYKTNLDFIPGRKIQEEFYNLADILSFDLSLGTPDGGWLNRKNISPIQLLARGIKTHSQFQSALEQGFDLFQGPFFKEPEYIRDRQLGSNELARLNLLRLIEAADPDVNVLAEAIRSDVSVSFRLLSYLNSAWFGLRQSIQSIDQAIMILGWSKLKSWLRALLLVDLAGQEEVPHELAFLSLQRGKFFELLAQKIDYWGFNPDTLFLLGMFSLMDSILGLPMAKVVELLPLETKIKSALQHDTNNEYRPLFELLESIEDGNWPALENQTRNLF